MAASQRLATRSLLSTGAPSARSAFEPRSRLTPTSWASGPDLGPAGWIQWGRWLGTVGRGSGWWIGDWVRYGNARYGERYKLVASITGYDTQTLMNMAYVTSRFAPSRRREGLSFSHHAEVAALCQEEQEHWLDRAMFERLSVRALRAELRRGPGRLDADRAHLEHAGDGGAPHTTGTVRCPGCGQTFRP
jgi:hypothetical protein